MLSTLNQPLRIAALVALMLGTLAPAQAAYHLPHDYYHHPHYVSHLPGRSVYVHGGVNYYYRGGWWYRPYGPRWVVVRPPIGLYVDALPIGFETLLIGGATYYMLNDIYYRRDGERYIVVDDPGAGGATAVVTPAAPLPQSDPAAHPNDSMFVYPKNGQNEQQQAKDRYECHRWAVKETGYDPTQPLGGVSEAQSLGKRGDYRRAMMACLNGRGYSLM